MEQAIKFSIIMPVYNCKRFLRKSIRSVMDQTYANWELILVDDGSNDGSDEICKEYALKDQRIIYFRKVNEGAMRARIAGCALTGGDYMVGMDADDWFNSNALEEIVVAIVQSKCDIISFGWRKDTGQIGRIPLEEGIYDKKAFLDAAILNTDHSLCNKAIKMNCVKRARLSVPDYRLSINADYLHIIPILCQAESVYVTKKILYNYRMVSSSMTHHVTLKNISDTAYVSKEVLMILRREGMLGDESLANVYISYLKMIGRRARALILDGSVADSEWDAFRTDSFYKCCEKYEQSEQLLPEDRLFFFLFRRGNITLIRLLWGRGKKFIPVICSFLYRAKLIV